MRTVKILSSDGRTHYSVLVGNDGKAVSCDEKCMGWHHRQHCRHLGDAEKLDAAERKKETAK